MTDLPSQPPARFEFATLAPWADEPATLPLVVAVAVVLVALVALQYWRERSGVSLLRGAPMLLLRVGAVLGVLCYALAPQRRTAQQQVRPSRVVVLVDDSQSMALSGQHADSSGSGSRGEQVQRLLLEDGLLDDLRQSHEVHVAAVSTPRSTVALAPVAGDAAPTTQAEQQELADRCTPQAASTALGDALRDAVAAQPAAMLAGVVLLSDGQSNAGENASLVARELGDREAPVHAIGFGSRTPLLNLAVRDLASPSRAYPSDEVRLVALVESQAAVGKTTSVTLTVRPAGNDASAATLLETRTLGPIQADGATTLEFIVTPDAEGTFEYQVAVEPLSGEPVTADNVAVAEVTVVDRLLRVLLAAGGPMRDFRYLRDQLKRDDAFEVHVLLQSAPPGITQDADQVLTAWPGTEQALSEYDVIVAFDVDWARIPEQAMQWLSDCVAERGAGFVFIAGQVNTPRWLRGDAASGPMTLLPVRPYPPPLLMATGLDATPRAAPLRLTRAGREASVLWVRGDPQQGKRLWEEELEGFYSTAEIDAVSPTATVYAQTVEAAESGRERVVFAEQFFGAGRCFYIGAPELWRLRTIDPALLSGFSTRLLQHVSQGRLLVEAGGASLAFERDRYNIGETLTLRLVLPGGGSQPPAGPLAVQIERPDGSLRGAELTHSQSAGGWSGRERAASEGVYRAVMTLPNTGQQLSAKAVVRVPELERSQTVRDAELLARIAEASGGRYYADAQAALRGGADFPPLAQALPSRSESVTVYGAPDEQFARRVSRWLLGLIAGCLLVEWTLRRAANLA